MLAQQFIKDGLSLRAIAGCGVEGREARRRDGVGRLLTGQLTQELPRIFRTLDHRVVIGEGELACGIARGICNRHEEGFGFIRTVSAHIEQAEGAVGDDVLRIDQERALHRLLRFLGSLGCPVEVGEPQQGLDGLRCGFHGFLEGRLRILDPTLRELQRTDACVSAGLGRIDRDRLFEFAHRAVEILEARQCVAAEDLGFGVLRIECECGVRPRLHVFERAGHEQELSRLDLGVDVIRQEVGRPHVFAKRVLEVVRADVAVTELQAHGAELRILLKGSTELDNRLGIFLLVEVLVALARVLGRIDLAAGAHEDRGQKTGGGRRSDVTSCDHLNLKQEGTYSVPGIRT